jgi:hypothetical protein
MYISKYINQNPNMIEYTAVILSPYSHIKGMYYILTQTAALWIVAVKE